MTHTFANDHEDEKNNSQLILKLSGSPLFIAKQLKKLAEECELNGKPCQGINIICGEGIREVATPIWNGKKY